MLRKIIRLAVNISRNYMLFWLVILAMLIDLSSNCSLAENSSKTSEANLRARVTSFYNSFREKNYGECWRLWVRENVGSKQEYIEYAQKHNFKIFDFKIESISLSGLNSKVKMNVTIIENNKEYTSVHFDAWIFTNGDWYISDFGRMDEDFEVTGDGDRKITNSN